jgi:predicted lipid-binding transport protein (Tim44 family)
MLTRPSRAIRRDLLSTVGRVDPDFSIVLFEDFVYALFAATHEARGKSQLATLAPYLRADVRQQLEGRSEGLLTEVKTPVIGAMRYVSVSGFGPRTPHEVTIELEANYTEVRAGGAEQTFYVVEQWSLVRAPTARSRPPDKASIIGCPCCGAPLSELRGNTCGYCKQVVDTGAFDWVVASIDERDRMERPPQVTADAPEAGTSLPTVVEPDARMRLQLMSRRDPAFQWPAFLQRVSLIHAELQPAWSTLEWTRARPFVSDPLFQMLAYWIESYRRSHLRNVNENARITSVELAAVISDKWFDAITVRVHATGLDYTVTDEGRVVSGSRSRERPYSEYWTLIRRSGASTKPPGSVGADGKVCPHCGAPLAINMAGSCTYCRAKVTSGDFDWVLSRIEQDEAYSG